MTTIKAIFDSYAKATEKVWAHDRLSTVGASGVFGCLRKGWFAQQETPHDPGYVDRYGAKKRGDLLEAHWFVPALLQGLPPGVELLWAGENQRTIVDGYSSATPDGLIVNRSNQDFVIEGITVPPGGCIGVECKSIDPRVDLAEAKAEHIGQVHVQMGLVRSCTEYRPEVVLVVYIDASFIDDVDVFPVRFDQAVYDAARQRAVTLMMAEHANALAPEGKVAGGKECEHCPYRSRCAAAIVQAIPKDEKPLRDDDMAAIAALVTAERAADAAKKASAAAHSEAQEKIKAFLRAKNTRKVKDKGWSVAYSSVSGKTSIDIEAAQAAGLDLSPFQKEGDPFERLYIRTSN